MTRSSIMARTWSIFRASYGYRRKGGIPFRSIGWKCFAACLRAAWQEYRDAKALVAVSIEMKAQQIDTLKGQLEDLVWMDNFRQAQALRSSIEAEISRLAA